MLALKSGPLLMPLSPGSMSALAFCKALRERGYGTQRRKLHAPLTRDYDPLVIRSTSLSIARQEGRVWASGAEAQEA